MGKTGKNTERRSLIERIDNNLNRIDILEFKVSQQEYQISMMKQELENFRYAYEHNIKLND